MGVVTPTVRGVSGQCVPGLERSGTWLVAVAQSACHGNVTVCGGAVAVFLSHTSELRRYPEGRSFVTAADYAVIRAGSVVVDMAYFTARDQFAALLSAQERLVGTEHPSPGQAAATSPSGPGWRGCGRSPRPARRVIAHPRAATGPEAPEHCDHPSPTRLLDQAAGGLRYSVRGNIASIRRRPGPP